MAIIKDGVIVAVQSIEELQKSKRKVFEIRFVNQKDAKKFCETMPKSSVKENVVSVSTKDINLFLKQLCDFNVNDISIKTQTLEELFMHFYGGDCDE